MRWNQMQNEIRFTLEIHLRFKNGNEMTKWVKAFSKFPSRFTFSKH